MVLSWTDLMVTIQYSSRFLRSFPVNSLPRKHVFVLQDNSLQPGNLLEMDRPSSPLSVIIPNVTKPRFASRASSPGTIGKSLAVSPHQGLYSPFSNQGSGSHADPQDWFSRRRNAYMSPISGGEAESSSCESSDETQAEETDAEVCPLLPSTEHHSFMFPCSMETQSRPTAKTPQPPIETPRRCSLQH